MFVLNSGVELGDYMIPEIDYFANVNFNVFSGYGIWKQPCDGSQNLEDKQCWFTLFFAAGERQLTLPLF